MKPIRVAVDIGGTFTDLQVHDARDGHVHAFKTPSTPQDPSEGLITGLMGAADRHGFLLADIGMILHGSTIATNAILERKLPTGALVTTAGFRDVLEIGRHIRKNVYGLKAEERPCLIPRRLRFELAERIRADGRVESCPSNEALSKIAEQLRQAAVETVAIAFLHAYRNPENEKRAAAVLTKALPGIAVATSHETSPEIREYERTSTTVLNALLKPVISGYLESVVGRLRAASIDAPLYLVQSNGGVASPEEAARLPARLLLSGPAGGAMAMADLARRHGLSNLVGLDMGGTSSDVSVVIDGQVGEAVEAQIDGLPVRLPMIDIRTVGAGGGSIARIDHGALRVGPESAGAVPGPICYQRGGTHPTVTDANAVLERINPAAFLGGTMRLDVDQATTMLSDRVAAPLGLTTPAAAAGILDVATTHMAGAIRLSLFEKGADPADFALAPFGGAAGLHACAVADELGIDTIVFPADASTLSARGILSAELRHDLSRSELMLVDDAAIPRLQTIIAELHDMAHQTLNEDGMSPAQRRIEFACDLRYRGQAYEITTPWLGIHSGPSVTAAAVEALKAAFHELHQIRFAHSSRDETVELVTVRAIAVGLLDKPQTATKQKAQVIADPAYRTIALDGEMRRLPVYTRDAALSHASDITGPALIEEEFTVLLIHEGWHISPLRNGDLRCQRIGANHDQH